MTEDDLIFSLHAGYERNGVYTDAFLARPAHGKPRPGVVLLSGMHGLSHRQREITRYYVYIAKQLVQYHPGNRSNLGAQRCLAGLG